MLTISIKDFHMSTNACLDDLHQKPGVSIVQHLVKSEDLNHHRTLYAGRLAEWFVEAGFIAAASLVPPDQVVCLKIHGLEFLHPVRVGDIANFMGKIVYAGRSSLMAYVRMEAGNKQIVDGFLTFIHVDEQGKTMPHGVVITPESEEETALYEQAKALAKRPA
jgi:acyl-CoA hydrolase